MLALPIRRSCWFFLDVLECVAESVEGLPVVVDVGGGEVLAASPLSDRIRLSRVAVDGEGSGEVGGWHEVVFESFEHGVLAGFGVPWGSAAGAGCGVVG